MTDTGRRIETLSGVPSEKVEQIVARFQADGAVQVTREAQSDGSWVVIAEFPGLEPVGKAG